jgi:hypothetical protein
MGELVLTLQVASIEESNLPLYLAALIFWIGCFAKVRSAGAVRNLRGGAGRMNAPTAPLVFTIYIAAPVEKVWDGFVSKEANQKIFIGADFEVDLKPGGAMAWSGSGKDGKPMRYVTGEVLRVDAPSCSNTNSEWAMGPLCRESKWNSCPRRKR